MAADDPPHGGITAQTVGVVHVIVPTKAAENGLAELPDHLMPPVLARTAVLKKAPGNLSQAKGIVKLPVGEKSSVGSDLGTVELKLQSTVEIDPQMGSSGFTRRVTWGSPVVMMVWH
jgi:hypothetical protein